MTRAHVRHALHSPPPFSIQRSLSQQRNRGGEMSLLSVPVLSDFIIYHRSLDTVSEVQFVY